MEETFTHKIENRIQRFGEGTIFFNTDFADLGTSDVIRQTLVRLVSSGKIIRLARGIYCFPKKLSKALGGNIIHPSYDEIAQSLARRYNCRIAPTGAYAMNALGLSTQIPANVVYYTDGPGRHIDIGKGRGITFIHTSSMKHFSYKSSVMQLIVLAMNELGQDNIDDQSCQLLYKHLQNVKKAEFDNDIKLANTWIRNKLINNYGRK